MLLLLLCYLPPATDKSLQLCLTLCDPIDGSPPGSPIPGILQARTLEWVAISFSNAGKWKVKVKSLSSVWLFATPWTAAYQAPPSMGFSRQKYWSGLPLPSPYLPPEKPDNHLMKHFQANGSPGWRVRAHCRRQVLEGECKIVATRSKGGGLEEVMEKMWLTLDLQVGSGESEAPQPLPLNLECTFCSPFPQLEPFSRTQPWESKV